MRNWINRLGWGMWWTTMLVLTAIWVAVSIADMDVSAQGTLSNQVLQLLSRINTWTDTNTFLDLRLPAGTVPSTTTRRFYLDASDNLYFNGGLIAGVGGGVTPHNLLSTTHSDTAAAAAARGAVLVGNATPAWSRLTLCPSGNYIGSNGTDTVCATSAAAFTAIPAAQITGTAGSFVGTNITALNASNLTSGTLPLARLTGTLTNAEIAVGAAIAYTKLALTGSVVNADVSAAAAIAYSKLSLTGSIVSADLAAGTLLFDRWNANGCTALQVPQYNGAAWVCKSLVTSDVTGAGTVSSVAMTVPTGFAISGSPITTSGTLALSFSNATANFALIGPTSGGAAAPTFRALVNGDLPLTGVGAGTYPSVTVNTAGVVTAASTTINLVTAGGATILPRANGGTGVAVSADDTLLVGSGAAWVAQSLPNCPTGALGYTTATNLFGCTTTGGPTHSILSATHTDSSAAAVVRGSMIVGNATPLWSSLAIGTIGTFLTSSGTDPSWSNTFARGSIVTSTPWTFTQTWNAAVTFTGLLVNVTDTSSNNASLFADYQIVGVSKYAVSKNGSIYFNGRLGESAATPTITAGFGTVPSITGTDRAFRVTQGTPVGATGTVTFGSLVAFTAAPVCTAVDETTTGVIPKVVPTTITVAVSNGIGTMVAGDLIAIRCGGF